MGSEATKSCSTELGISMYLSILCIHICMFIYNYVCMYVLFVTVCQIGYNMQPWPVASIQW